MADGLHIGKQGETFYLYDSRQTSGFLCATSDPSILVSLLAMEEASKGSVRTLITGEVSPYDLNPPSPAQQTFTGISAARINLGDIMK